MKKLKFGLALALLLGGFAAVGAVVHSPVNEVKRVEAAETEAYSYTFTSSQFSANGTKTLGGVSWTLAGDGGYWGWDSNGKGQQLGSSGKPYKSLTLTSTSFKNVKTVKITTAGASSVNASFVCTVGGTQIGASTKLTTASTEYTLTADTVRTGEIQFKYTQTSSKALYIKAIKVYTDDSAAVTTYSTTFNMNDGTSAVHHTSNNAENEEVSFPSDPVRDGYKFEGWYTAAEGGSKVEEGILATADLTLYAHWSLSTYAVTFDTAGKGACDTASADVNVGESVELPEVTPNSGWKFEGWYLGETLVEDEFTPTSSCTLVAKYTRVLAENQKLVKLNNANTKKSTETSYAAGTSTVDGVDFSWQMAGEKSTMQIRSNNSNSGIVATSSIGFVRAVDAEFNVGLSGTTKILNVYGSNEPFEAPTSLYNTATAGTLIGTLTSEKNSLDITADYEYIGVRSSSGTIWLDSVSFLYEVEEASVSTARFDANGGTFADPDEWGTMEFTGERTVVLPIASDLETTAYKYTTLVGWTDGNETYAPGASVTISQSTKFTAVYEAPELITIEQALEICQLTGETNTTYSFTVEGVVSELDDSGVATYGNFTCMLSDETGSIKAYRVKCDKSGLDLLNGDTIKVTGILVNYGGDTPEFTSGGTYEFVSRPVVEPTLEEKLAEYTTNASVGFSYVKTGEDYTFSNVRLSFRGTISAELFAEVMAAGVTGAGIECSIEGEEAYTIDCSANIGENADGSRYVFGSLRVPEGQENVEVTAKAFVIVNGARLYLASTTHSLVSAVSAYLGGAVTLTEEQLAAVTALAASLGINA